MTGLMRSPWPQLSTSCASLSLRLLADEDVDVALALEQALDEVAADEPGGARDEVGRQRSLPP